MTDGGRMASQDSASSSGRLSLDGAGSVPLEFLRTLPEEGSGSRGKQFKRELFKLNELAGPLLIQYTFSYGLSIVSAGFVGHLHDPVLLSAAVLANSLYNITGYSVVSGLSSGMETLCGQAYGARNYRLLGGVMQRALLITWLVCIPIVMLWANTKHLLLWLGQEPAIVEGATQYLWLISPTIFMVSAAECLRRYLLAQRVVNPGVVVSAATFLISPLYYWVLVFKLGGGLAGAAHAFTLSQLTQLLGLAGYTAWRDWRRRDDPHSTFSGISWEAVQGWPLYLRYGVPAAFMLCAEWWVYEVVIFMAGRLPNADVAVGVMGIAFQVSTLVYMVAMSFGSSVNTRVANHLGAGSAQLARLSFLTGLVTVFVTQVTLAAATLLARHWWVAALTNSVEVQALVVHVAPAVAVSFIGDGCNAVLSGTLRGAGRQVLGAMLNLVGYWCLGVPLAWLFGFHLKLGALGFWIGLACTTNFQSLLLGAVISRFDWQREVVRAKALQEEQEAGEVAGEAGGGWLGGHKAGAGPEDAPEDEERPLLLHTSRTASQPLEMAAQSSKDLGRAGSGAGAGGRREPDTGAGGDQRGGA